MSLVVASQVTLTLATEHKQRKPDQVQVFLAFFFHVETFSYKCYSQRKNLYEKKGSIPVPTVSQLKLLFYLLLLLAI
jgi:hypothetical protein